MAFLEMLSIISDRCTSANLQICQVLTSAPNKPGDVWFHSLDSFELEGYHRSSLLSFYRIASNQHHPQSHPDLQPCTFRQPGCLSFRLPAYIRYGRISERMDGCDENKNMTANS
jgi:hypothetical protein